MNNSSIRLSSVEFSGASVSEIDGNQMMLSLPREQIASMTLERGIKSERPLVDILIGSAFILTGFYVYWPLLLSLWGKIFLSPGSELAPRIASSKLIVFGLILVPVGVYLIFTALKKRYFLLIITTHGMKRKIVFDADISYTEIRSFIEQVRTRYGYQIAATMREE